jgi:hypothetical protein
MRAIIYQEEKSRESRARMGLPSVAHTERSQASALSTHINIVVHRRNYESL